MVALSGPLAILTSFQCALLTAAAISVACAVLSVVVVLRRWAFIGEGIAHAGFGGIGTAWLLSLGIPALNGAGAYGVAVVFCLGTGLCIGYVTRRRGGAEPRFGADSAIGIFLVASLAWGFVALGIYNRHHGGADEGSWEKYLFGSIEMVSAATAISSVAISVAVLVTVAAFSKEIISYVFDPLMAEVSGVAVGGVHYLLMLLMALVIVVGMRIAGNVLVTALLVLPGATALSVARQWRSVLAVSIGVGLIGAVAGVVLNHYVWPFLPSGPAMVLVMFVEFLAALALAAVRRRGTAEA